MKTVYKLGLIAMCVGLFLGLAVLGVSLKVETKPAVAQAADTTATFLVGDKDGFGVGLPLGGSYTNMNTFTPGSNDPATMDRPLIASSWGPAASAYPDFTSPYATKPLPFYIPITLPAGAVITGATLNINVADIDEGDPANAALGIDDHLYIDNHDINHAFANVDQFITGVAGYSGLATFTLDNSWVQSDVASGQMKVLIDEPTRNGAILTAAQWGQAEIFAIDYAELTLTYSNGGSSTTCTPACSGNQTCVNGACVSNTTSASVTTNPASNIQANSATLNGYLNGLGSDPSASTWFQWGTSASYGSETTKVTMNTAGPMNATVSLTPNTTYHFRAVAETGAGRTYGQDMSFTAGNSVNNAGVQTLSATSITPTSAMLNGQLLSLGNDNSGQVFFQWGTTVGYGNTITTQTQNVAGPFNQTISNLTPGTTYHFRAGVTTSAGTVYGSDSSFATNQNNGGGGTNALVVSCNAQPSSVLTNQAVIFNSSVTGGGGVASYVYTWSGACNAGSQNCSATYSQSGTYTAILSVYSSGQTQSTSCTVSVNGSNNTSTCTQNYQQRCVNSNQVFWFDSCNVQGAYVATCGSNQYCSNGTCVNNNYNNNNNITCSSNFDCGGNNNSNGNLICQGNSVYSTSYNTSTCINPGTTSSYCSNNNSNNYNNSQFLYSCTGNQYCSNGSCVNQNNNNYNNNYGNIYVTTQVRNLSTGNLNWSTSVSANPGDILQYQITLQNNSGTNINNVTVRDNLPPNLIYNNNLMVDGISNGGNITYGVNIGSISSYQTRTVTYQVQVAGAQNFTFGTTTLNDNVSITSDNGTAANSSASVTVNRSGVLGATSVSTGLLTGNFWVDSFLAPLILALIALWAWQAGLLNTFGIADWVSGKKAKKNEVAAKSKLEDRINAIRNKETA